MDAGSHVCPCQATIGSRVNMNPTPTKDLSVRWRFPLLIMGMLSLLFGVSSGLGYIGVVVPDFSLKLANLHGVLMIPAFLGTVISLERAVALGRKWAYLAPTLSALGAFQVIRSVDSDYYTPVFILSAVMFVIVSVAVLLIQLNKQNGILLLGSICLLAGNIQLCITHYPASSILWWMSFLLLTIAGERLELSRLVVRSEALKNALALLTLIPPLGALLNLFSPLNGMLLFSTGLMGIAVWLLTSDIARKTIHMNGLTRFTAACMLSGYGWLIIASVLFIAFGLMHPNSQYLLDPALHSFFLGFVFTMVIGHALLIFPSITRLKMPWSPTFYAPLVLLHLALIVRIAGALSGDFGVQQWGARGNAVALVLFLIMILATVIRGQFATDRGK